jgi:hypothetical protein
LPRAVVNTIDLDNGFGPGTRLALNGGASLVSGRLLLTDGQKDRACSAFWPKPVKVQHFSTAFRFQLTNAAADGFTFAIQRTGPTVIGRNATGLGYGTIAKSVALQFNLFPSVSRAGVGTNGLIKCDTDLAGVGIDLHNGHVLQALLEYDGTTLTVRITDPDTQSKATLRSAVNIPAVVGDTTAYVGFTAASGGQGATQEILSWTYREE